MSLVHTNYPFLSLDPVQNRPVQDRFQGTQTALSWSHYKNLTDIVDNSFADSGFEENDDDQYDSSFIDDEHADDRNDGAATGDEEDSSEEEGSGAEEGSGDEEESSEDEDSGDDSEDRRNRRRNAMCPTDETPTDENDEGSDIDDSMFSEHHTDDRSSDADYVESGSDEGDMSIDEDDSMSF